MQEFNNMMPQAKWFFVYIYWDEKSQTNQLGCHVVFGFERDSTEQTRKLVQSGSQVSMLLYLGPVCELLPHHTRLIRGLTGEPIVETYQPLGAGDDGEDEDPYCPLCDSGTRGLRNTVERSDGKPGPCQHIWHEGPLGDWSKAKVVSN